MTFINRGDEAQIRWEHVLNAMRAVHANPRLSRDNPDFCEITDQDIAEIEKGIRNFIRAIRSKDEVTVRGSLTAGFRRALEHEARKHTRSGFRIVDLCTHITRGLLPRGGRMEFDDPRVCSEGILIDATYMYREGNRIYTTEFGFVMKCMNSQRRIWKIDNAFDYNEE